MDVVRVAVVMAGALVGFAVSIAAGRWVLPFVLRSQDAHTRGGNLHTYGIAVPAFMRDPQRVRAMTILIYRFVFPIVFSFVGAVGAYYMFDAGSP
jgi:hypothetical protein